MLHAEGVGATPTAIVQVKPPIRGPIVHSTPKSRGSRNEQSLQCPPTSADGACGHRKRHSPLEVNYTRTSPMLCMSLLLSDPGRITQGDGQARPPSDTNRLESTTDAPDIFFFTEERRPRILHQSNRCIFTPCTRSTPHWPQSRSESEKNRGAPRIAPIRSAATYPSSSTLIG